MFLPVACVLPFIACLICLQDHQELYEMGVAAIYGPGTRIPAAAMDMIQLLIGPEELGDKPAAAAAAGNDA